ncbi:MAG: transketolase [Gemmatimonadetes bacterium]|nr:MAG: transketolase [Gemmatimonadota bacterium]
MATRKSRSRVLKLKSITLRYEDVIRDYRCAIKSREASLLGRKEVMGGKAKFGIFGDGKEVPQLAAAHSFRKGDFRAGYYRDQTFMLALGVVSFHEYFAQLYAHADVNAEPATAGRSMNAHFATRLLNPDGTWKELTEMYNSAADLSPTGSQMPKLVGLAYASKLYRHVPELSTFTQFSKNGNEIAWGMIGNASCAEGMFWESINAIGVLKSPAIISIWDDHYGISVRNEHQVTKEDIYELLKGFQCKRSTIPYDGFEIYTVKGWDYPKLVETYAKVAQAVRKDHHPAIIHVDEITQPQGHSTSGSHERYKSRERLEWEKEFDCIKKMREWMIDKGIATLEELEQWEEEDRAEVRRIRDEAWEAFITPIQQEKKTVIDLFDQIAAESTTKPALEPIKTTLDKVPVLGRKHLMSAIQQVLIATRQEPHLPARQRLIDWKRQQDVLNTDRYSSHLYSESERSALKIPEVKPVYSEKSKMKNGFEILNICFDKMLERHDRLIAFGEDVGELGGVNQGFRGLQDKYGLLRVSDTGIRECTIIGQAIGMAMRGLRPLAEIQYLDYILYGLQLMSDDLATLHWRTKGGQKAPVIIRTRGHRLEGIWHAGSPLAGILNLVRGIHVLVPRNMVQAAGFYNTLLASDDPGLVIEVLNGYRLKERLPDNIGEFTLPLGVPEVLRQGTDVTLVTYGACCRLALEAAERLAQVDIEVEVIDVQSLLPFDLKGIIVESLKKTNRILFLDEDVPGGTTAYMMQEVLEKQDGYHWLDSKPRTLPAKPHRPAYGSDGDYFSKPNVEDIFREIYQMMHEFSPADYPLFLD